MIKIYLKTDKHPSFLYVCTGHIKFAEDALPLLFVLLAQFCCTTTACCKMPFLSDLFVITPVEDKACPSNHTTTLICGKI